VASVVYIEKQYCIFCTYVVLILLNFAVHVDVKHVSNVMLLLNHTDSV